MAGPGDEIAAGIAGCGQLRASQADREQVIEMLKTAFVEDRLTKGEFDLGVGRALGSRTLAELAAVVFSIPTGPAGAEPSREAVRAQARPPVGTDVKAGVRAIAAIYLIAAILWLVAGLAGDNAAGGAAFFLAFMVTVVASFFSLYGAVVLLDSLRHKRSGRQPPANEGGKESRSPRRPDPGRPADFPLTAG
jgi:uncharacterized protein DUF1707